jgi:hypothetical protein
MLPPDFTPIIKRMAPESNNAMGMGFKLRIMDLLPTSAYLRKQTSLGLLGLRQTDPK